MNTPKQLLSEKNDSKFSFILVNHCWMKIIVIVYIQLQNIQYWDDSKYEYTAIQKEENLYANFDLPSK